MSTVPADIQLTPEQEKTIVNLTSKLSEAAFGKLKPSDNPKDQPKSHLIEWLQYLMLVAQEGANVRSNKKSRTTTKRRTHLRSIAKSLGHYPTDTNIEGLFGKDAASQQDLIALLYADAQQLQEYKPVKKTDIDKIQERLAKLKKQLGM